MQENNSYGDVEKTNDVLEKMDSSYNVSEVDNGNTESHLSDKDIAREKSKRRGFSLRMAYAVFLSVMACVGIACGIGVIFAGRIAYDDEESLRYAMHFMGMWVDRDIYICSLILIGFGALAAVCTPLAYICAFKGRTKRWADILAICIGAITLFVIFNCITAVISFVLYIELLYAVIIIVAVLLNLAFGIVELIGGMKGDNGLIPKSKQKNEQKDDVDISRSNESAQANAHSEGVAEARSEAEAEQENIPHEYIQSKTTARGKLATLIILSVMYAALIVAGALLIGVPSLSNIIHDIGICEAVAARAYGVTIGSLWLSLVPTFILYFAVLSPYVTKKKIKVLLFIISVVLSIACVAGFFIVINAVKIDGYAVKHYFEGSDVWFVPVTTVLATVGMIICYVLNLFKLNPDKIRNKKPERKNGNILGFVLHAIACLGWLIMSAIKGIFKFKESRPELFICIATLLLTWLAYFVAFIVSIICILGMLCMVAMLFAGVMSLYYSTPPARHFVRDEYGHETELQKLPYIEERGEDIYADEYGNKYYTRDDGATFYQK